MRARRVSTFTERISSIWRFMTAISALACHEYANTPDMPIAIKLAMTLAHHCAMTPAEGEIIYDTTNDRLRVGDGAVAGGFALPNAFDIQKGAFNTVNASGTDTLTVTLDPVPASYTTNMTVHFKAAATNTGAATLNVNSLGAKNIYKASGGALVALGAGDLTIGAFYTVRYDGTQFVLEGAAGGGVTSTAAADASLVVTPTTGAATAKINTNNSLGVGAGVF